MARSKQAKTILAQEVDTDQLVSPSPNSNNLLKVKIHDPNVDLVTPAQRIANDKFCYRNYMIHAFREAFPHNVLRHYIAEYYPYALGGGIYFDYPKTEIEKQDCKTKKAIMKKLGFRYAVIEKDMDDHAVAEQLER